MINVLVLNPGPTHRYVDITTEALFPRVMLSGLFGLLRLVLLGFDELDTMLELDQCFVGLYLGDV